MILDIQIANVEIHQAEYLQKQHLSKDFCFVKHLKQCDSTHAEKYLKQYKRQFDKNAEAQNQASYDKILFVIELYVNDYHSPSVL